MNKCIEQCLLIEQKARIMLFYMHIAYAETRLFSSGKRRENYMCMDDYSDWSGRGSDGDNLRMRNAQV